MVSQRWCQCLIVGLALGGVLGLVACAPVTIVMPATPTLPSVPTLPGVPLPTVPGLPTAPLPGPGSFAVINATVSVDLPSYSGSCPQTFTFSGVITANGPGTVTYRWERSDGASAPVETVTFGAAGAQTVTTTWTLSPASYSGWERLQIIAPNTGSSNQAVFTVTCGGASSFAVTNVIASVDTPSYSGACPKTFNFSAVVTASGPGTVTYVWERSDGASAPNQTLTFDAAGSQTVNTTWMLSPASYSGWERVKILAPNALTSNQVAFALTCAGAPSFAVTNVTASVNPSSYSGACPKTYNFSGVITANGPGTVTYTWERSDGASAPTESVTFIAAGTKTVTDSWTLSPASYSGWERLKILSPNALTSNQATFTLTCGTAFAVTSATASVNPSSYSGACPKTYNFSGVITANGPGTVTYTWERSDGASAPTDSVTFAAAGTKTVTDSWTLSPASYSGWERLKILSPNALTSNQAAFTLTCGTAFAVTNVTASVNPASYSGACPKTYNFSGIITANGPGTVTYTWERSDGAGAPTESVTFTSAGTKTVTDSWTLSPASYSGWERLKILSPNALTSNQAAFTLTCGTAFAVTSATASVSPSSYSGTCPKTFNFSGAITANGPGTVTYVWERSDGASAPTESVTFTTAGTKTVSDSWTLSPASYSGWERLKIISPNALTSNQAAFTLSCGVAFAVTNVTTSVSPTSFSGTCPKTFTFSAVITANGPGTVTYTWDRSDGGTMGNQTVTFTSAGSKTVTSTWQLSPSSYTGWKRLRIIAPNALTSNQAAFTLSCN